jgi:hypothetical protein
MRRDLLPDLLTPILKSGVTLSRQEFTLTPEIT